MALGTTPGASAPSVATVEVPSRRHRHRVLLLAAGTAAVTGGLAVIGSVALGIPMRDPDGFLGPGWVRMPAIVAVCLLLDVLPRAAWRLRAHGELRSVQGLVRSARDVAAARWPWRRLVPVLVAVASFYITYVGYRNLKNFLPFIHEGSQDLALVASDRLLAFGNNPAEVLHAVLGTGVSAHVLSFVYMGYLIFVPVSVAVALIFWRHLSHGLWYVTALCLNWALGAASYYLIPASGPFYALPWDFTDLSRTDVTGLQAALVRNRSIVMADPDVSGTVSGIAAFASLHVSVVFTAALIVQLIRMPRLVRRAMWGFFVLTVLATIYFGWHYIVDDLAGVAIGGIAVWAGAWATGNLRDPARRREDDDEDDVAGSADALEERRRGATVST
ncbi:inositol phosphorylceramide synthase [Streptomyces sp. NP160]|uniref:phosphatase PAP2 family protein n=1 Tax=Streptomyces sp. NP160 TaxID=2586637 RepID=UPI001118E9D3|nr:phosphatase PAP2 family protein [Streptomyces sp. NP160]TNM64446.1 inositol phosphorylceramide synthase [Streptomyces sp. NP160]